MQPRPSEMWEVRPWSTHLPTWVPTNPPPYWATTEHKARAAQLPLPPKSDQMSGEKGGSTFEREASASGTAFLCLYSSGLPTPWGQEDLVQPVNSSLNSHWNPTPSSIAAEKINHFLWNKGTPQKKTAASLQVIVKMNHRFPWLNLEKKKKNI